MKVSILLFLQQAVSVSLSDREIAQISDKKEVIVAKSNGVNRAQEDRPSKGLQLDGRQKTREEFASKFIMISIPSYELQDDFFNLKI